MLAGAAVGGLAPVWFALAPASLVAAALFARTRLELVRAHLNGRCLTELWAWACLAAICRCGSIAVALASVGVSSPLTASLIGLLGLELSALIPVAPGLAGVGGAAVAVAIAAHGVPSAIAVAGGVAFYVAEAAAGIAFGTVATAVFIARYRSVTTVSPA
jgi:hypothetical protein